MKLNWSRMAWIVGTWLLAAVVFTLADSELGMFATGIAFIFLIIPILIASFIDWASSRPVSEGTTVAARFGRLVAAGPAILFGLTSITIGFAIIAWVLYNTFVERQPEYTGSTPWMSFGIAPAAIAFGASVIRSTLRAEPSRPDAFDGPLEHEDFEDYATDEGWDDHGDLAADSAR